MRKLKSAYAIVLFATISFIPNLSNAALATSCLKTSVIPAPLVGQVPVPTARCTLSWSASDHHPNYNLGELKLFAGGTSTITESFGLIIQNYSQMIVHGYLRWTQPGFYLVNAEGRFWFLFVGGENGSLEWVDHPQNPEVSPLVGMTFP